MWAMELVTSRVSAGPRPSTCSWLASIVARLRRVWVTALGRPVVPEVK